MTANGPGGRVVLLTGASSGIGWASAVRHAQAGDSAVPVVDGARQAVAGRVRLLAGG